MTISSLFLNRSAFVQVRHMIPIHTAHVERTFTQLKLIKRNRLTESTLDSLLRISIKGSSPENYLLSEAVKLCMGKEKTEDYVSNEIYLHNNKYT